MDLADLAERLALAGGSPPGTLPVADGTHARAAVAILLRASEPGAEVLLMRRAQREGDRWSGQIGLPGGHSGKGDADLLATAIREAHEEVGLDLAREAELVGRLRPVQAKARGALLPMWITPFVFLARGTLVPRPSAEADEVFWFPLERAQAGELAWTHRYLRGEEERVLPAWRHGEHVVWGLTFEILTGFLRLTE